MIDVTPFWIMTGFWLFVGCILPWAIPVSDNRSIIQTMLILTSICCYVFWLGPYMMQFNPVIAPTLKEKNYFIAWAGWYNKEPVEN